MEYLQSTLTWLTSSDNPLGYSSSPSVEYTPLSLPGSQYVDDTPLYSYDYLHEFSIYCLHIAFDKFIISGSYELIQIHHLDTSSVTSTTSTTISEISSSLFLPNDTLIRTISGDFDWVYSLAMIYGVTPLIASAHRDCYIRLWDYFDSDLLYPKIILSGHSHAVSSLCVLQGVHPLLISGSFDTTISIWDITSKQRLHILKQPKRPVRTLSYLDSSISSSHKDESSSSLQEQQQQQQQQSFEQYLCCGDDSGTIFIWYRSWILYRKIPYPDISLTQSPSAIKSITTSYWNGTPRVFAGYDDGFIRAYEINTGQVLLSYQGHEQAVRSMVLVEVTHTFFSNFLFSLNIISSSPLNHRHQPCRILHQSLPHPIAQPITAVAMTQNQPLPLPLLMFQLLSLLVMMVFSVLGILNQVILLPLYLL